MKRTLLMVSIILALLVACGASSHAQDTRQRYQWLPPFKGQASNFSDWTLDPKYFGELTNFYIDEQGVLQKRPAAYCWLDSVSTSKPILGAINYKRWIEGGAKEYLVFNTNNEMYYTTSEYGNTNTNITPQIADLADDGIPVFVSQYNNLYMANGEDNPLQWDMDGNCIQLGRCTFSGSIKFEDDNEIVSATNFESEDYHFRPGWDLIIADTNNNGTYEIYSVDSNVMVVTTTAGEAVDWTSDYTDATSTLTGIGYPSDLTATTRTETIVLAKNIWGMVNPGSNDYIMLYYTAPTYFGLRVGMSVNISGTVSNDGDVGTITSLSTGVFGNMYIWTYIYVSGDLTTEWYADSGNLLTLTATATITDADSFNPATIAGHKGRLFAGGVKEYPTRLYYSQSRLRDSAYYDQWRDAYGQTEGSGYFDVQDKVTALVGEWNGMLIVFCESSILKIIGDDPGFDILTPSQAIVYQPVPVSKEIGCIGPNAWCEVGNDIFFMSTKGLHQLSMVQGADLPKAALKSLPISDIVQDFISTGVYKQINMKFLSDLGALLIICDIDGDESNEILAYNVANESWSKWTFASDSEPRHLFNAVGPLIDPNETVVPNDGPRPYDTMWFGSQDGKLFAFTKAYCYDRDYEDPNGTNTSFTATAITAKLNMGDPFLEKNFRRIVTLASPQVNYSTSSAGALNIYRKIDDGDWSSAVTKSFSTHSDTAGTAVDYYEGLDFGIGAAGMGKSIQLKFESTGTAGRFGLSLIGAMVEYESMDYRL